MRIRWLLLWVCCTAAFPMAAQDAVWIANFPEIQDIRGSVTVGEPIPAAVLERFEGVTVSSVRPDETTRLVSAGTVDTVGYSTLVVSLAAEIKGTVPAPCTVGAVLIPDEGFADEALKEGHLLFPLEVEIDVPKDSPRWVSSQSLVFEVAFPRYRVLLYNTGSRTATASLYAMLRTK